MRIRVSVVIGVVGVFAGVVAAYVEVAVVGQAWAVCEIGSSGANGFVLLFSLAVLAGVHAVLAAAAAGAFLLGRRPLALVAAVLPLGVAVLLAWGYFAFSGLPLANEGCPAGEPAWWPAWLPPAAETYAVGPAVHAR